ncbi:DMT family transporter [Pseudoalteromonas denitrificans]|jgi:transporter family-2 protein|uniref:Transporter family-2 protein n=1 Tax=Pseudoalteromonas denitrificans DSM 6059 TaxID=1123010 RepID=A0A1I1V0L8_9GAMM|nr:DMT family transporter [Pseudoalteromonas denitrificans]SFD76581.1 transporter family-2 protein [Pseudoalteromonas denitrificans DSM 6059]
MSILQHPIFYALLMCIAGLGIPIMAALNGELATKLNSPALATTILFTVACLLSVGYLLVSGGIPKAPIQKPIPMFFYFGGFFVIFYIITITWVAPKFGIGNAISFVLLGQLISMVLIDHFGLFGAPQHIMSIKRLVGLAFMAIGVYLTVRRI